MDALGVILQNVGLVDLALARHGSALPVALAADEGNALGGDGGGAVLDGQDVVLAVTVPAAGGQGIAFGGRPPVQVVTGEPPDVVVTGSAVDLLDGDPVGKLRTAEVGMAADAGEGPVDRSGELPLVDKKGNAPPAALRLESLVGVAGEAIAALLGPEKRRRQDEETEHDGPESDDLLQWHAAQVSFLRLTAFPGDKSWQSAQACPASSRWKAWSNSPRKDATFCFRTPKWQARQSAFASL